MEISRTSWHYRLIRWFRPAPSYTQERLADEAGVTLDWEPVGTCAYFRELIFALFVSLAIAPIALVLAAVASPFIGLYWLYDHSPFAKSDEERHAANVRRLQKQAAKRQGIIQAYRDGHGHKFCERVEYTD